MNKAPGTKGCEYTGFYGNFHSFVLTPDETRSKLSAKFYLQIIPDPTFFHKYVQLPARACSSEKIVEETPNN